MNRRRLAARRLGQIVLLHVEIGRLNDRIDKVIRRINENAPETGQGSEGNQFNILPGHESAIPSVAPDTDEGKR